MASTGLLIDGDAILYPAGFIAASRGLGCSETIDMVTARLRSINDFFGPSFETTWFFTGKGGPKWRDQFRNRIPYKDNRKVAKMRPLYITEVLESLLINYPQFTCKCNPELGEADDYIAAEAAGLHWHNVIVHVDKDLDQIPGEHWSIDLTKDCYYIDHVSGPQHKYAQILSGDAADNIPGLPGIGSKRAMGLVKDCKTEKELFDRSFEIYAKKLPAEGYNDNDIVELYYETANLVHLRTNLHDDCWMPPE